VESIADARMELDAALRVVCETAISQCVAIATASLESCLASPADLTVADVTKTHAEFTSTADHVINHWAQRLRLYLDDDIKTVGILLSPMQDKVVEVYEAFRFKAMNRKGQEAYTSIEGILMSTSDLRRFLERISQVNVRPSDGDAK